MDIRNISVHQDLAYELLGTPTLLKWQVTYTVVQNGRVFHKDEKFKTEKEARNFAQTLDSRPTGA